jgi:hypothetical protein
VFVLGASIAAATMVRPTTYYLPPIVVVLLLVRFWRVPARRLIAILVAFALPLIAVVGGWELRNHYRVDSWQLSSSAAITLYCYNAASVQAKATHVTVKAARDELGCNPGGWDELKNACPKWWRCALPGRSAYGPGYDEMNTRGFRILEKHPAQTAEVVAAGLMREVFGPGTDTVSRFLNVRSAAWLGAPLFVWNAVLMLLALVGVAVALRSPKRAFWASLIVLVTYVLIASAGAETSARFRTPLVPLLGLLAARAMQHGLQWLRAQRDAADEQSSAQTPLEAIE